MVDPRDATQLDEAGFRGLLRWFD
ncbi:hypothetical protein ZEAMMB73_Zm00001d047710 [Zea mays]|nr:hypothetical protein ZEAMMB73_Zm00001d047710 [Zea mays]